MAGHKELTFGKLILTLDLAGLGATTEHDRTGKQEARGTGQEEAGQGKEEGGQGTPKRALRVPVDSDRADDE